MIQIAQMRGLVLLLISSIPLFGCGERQASVPAGCYQFEDGEPFLRITGTTGAFTSGASLKSFQIGPWRHADRHSMLVTPAFVLHEGRNSFPGRPAWMAEPVRSLPWGTIRYERQGNRDVLLLPIEAYGEVKLVRGNKC